jgi:hypothetical protein
MDVEPVAVEPAANTEGLRRAFSEAIARNIAFVPNPPKNDWPPPILLKYSGAETWSAFARNASMWSIDVEKVVFAIVAYRDHPDSYWAPDNSRKIEFPSGTPVGEVINRMIAILQGAAQGAPSHEVTSYRRPNRRSMSVSLSST